MESCPFCGAEVPEQLIVYGGSCPSCFGEIPGEEAATDPGTDVMEAENAKMVAQAKRRSFVPLLLLLLLGTGVAAFVAFLAVQPEPELPIMDLDEDAGYLAYLANLRQEEAKRVEAERAAAEAAKKESEKTAVAAKGPGKASPTGAEVNGPGAMSAPKLGGASGLDEASLLSGLKADSGEDVLKTVRQAKDLELPGSKGDIDLPGAGPSTGRLTSGDSMMGSVQVKQEARPLSDPNEVKLMIYQVLDRRLPKLRNCYENALKANPGLGGEWQLIMTIETDGSVGAPQVRPLGMSNANFESCMMGQMTKWRFSRLTKPKRISKKVEFRKR